MGKRAIKELMELTIASAYESVLHEETWAATLENLSKLTGADSSTFVVLEGTTPEIIQTHHLDPAVMQAYNTDFAMFDPFHGNIMRRPMNRVVHDRREVDQGFIRKSVWFQEFYRQFQIHTIMALPLFDDGCLVGSFNIQRLSGQGDFSVDEFNAMSEIAPHLVRAAKMNAKANALRRSAEFCNAALDKLSMPIMLIDENGKVVLTNCAAEILIQREESLHLSRDRFTVNNNGEISSPKVTRRITETLIRRGTNRKPLRMTTMPLAPRSELNSSWQKPLCMVTFDDPELIPVSLSDILQTLFTLTTSEARVCIAIGADGLTPQECSDQFNVTINTIRTQIRGIYLKTGVKRQAELVRMLTMLAMTRQDGN